MGWFHKFHLMFFFFVKFASEFLGQPFFTNWELDEIKIYRYHLSSIHHGTAQAVYAYETTGKRTRKTANSWVPVRRDRKLG